MPCSRRRSRSRGKRRAKEEETLADGRCKVSSYCCGIWKRRGTFWSIIRFEFHLIDRLLPRLWEKRQSIPYLELSVESFSQSDFFPFLCLLPPSFQDCTQRPYRFVSGSQDGSFTPSAPCSSPLNACLLSWTVWGSRTSNTQLKVCGLGSVPLSFPHMAFVLTYL